MPIYRCNKCGFVSEDAITPVGIKTLCGRCGTPSTVYGTVFYVEKLVERYFAALREVAALQQPDKAAAGGEVAALTPPEAVATPEQTLADADAHSSAALATATQHAPLQAWFKSRQIDAQFDHALVDTTGFFDDAARTLGDDWALFSELVDRVRFAYRKSHSWVNLELASLSQKDAQAINTLCRQFYSHTFFSRYHYQKQEKIVRLTLQTAPAVRQFFDGGWLEWYAFVELIQHARARNRGFSCARGVKVVFPNEDLHELDVVLLPEGQSPICVECKSGEFRRDIDKYLRLRKRLGIERSRFIVCAADLTDEQAAGLTAMYELTFVNLSSLKRHVDALL
ncbi:MULTISPECIES: DUF1887 family protein [unclassified Variovorax]|uniref:DUF1887 family protein n=1 Tax=unclassified Variovorax TaxID=663243 RepID=UPI001BD6C807|nr:MULTISPECIES: DUF1887 family protein [unclassified Variovorax]